MNIIIRTDSSTPIGTGHLMRCLTLADELSQKGAQISFICRELQALVIESERAWRALGQVSYGPTDAEKASAKSRRSLYVVKDMSAGEVFTKENLKTIRPGLGLSPKYYDILLGKKVKKDVKKGTPVDWELL